MASLNKVILIGHLGKDTDARYTAWDEKANTYNLPVAWMSFKARCGKFEEKKVCGESDD